VTESSTTPTPEPGAPAAAGLGPLERLWREHAPAVYRAAHRITGNPADAEDVLQTVYLRLARRSGPELGPDAGGYLHRSAVNAALDVVRSRQRAGWAPLEDLEAAGKLTGSGSAASEFEPEREQRLKRLRRALRTALSRLSPRSAEIFALRHFEGLTYQQIAEATGNSSGLVAVLLHRTRARLKKELVSLGHAVGDLT
jgi:RNA polymerase sigma-70 factor (ECF subfamily)